MYVERHPEWLDDEPEGGEHVMTFDESGQFVSVKDLKSSRGGGEPSKPSKSESEKKESLVKTNAAAADLAHTKTSQRPESDSHETKEKKTADTKPAHFEEGSTTVQTSLETNSHQV